MSGRPAAGFDEHALNPGPLSEADVIRLAREQSPAGAVAEATEGLAEARTRTAGLPPNPTVAWERETVETGPRDGQGSQDLVTATLPIDIVRPRAARSLVAAQSAWLRTQAALARDDAVLEAVMAFYEVVLAARRVDVLSRSVGHLEDAARILERREAVGSASGYESSRLAVASELSRSRLAEARGALATTKARLAGLIAVDAGALRVRGQLNLMSPSDEAALARRDGADRPAVRRADDAQRLAQEAVDRAEWAWMPTVELAGGLKRADIIDRGDGYGYVVAASLTLPLFDRGQAQRERATATRALATARAARLKRTIEADIRIAQTIFHAARQELERFEATTSEQIEALLAAAQSGYREGERTIVELLDAQRAQTDVAERRLFLLGTAKRAEARLRSAAGAL